MKTRREPVVSACFATPCDYSQYLAFLHWGFLSPQWSICDCCYSESGRFPPRGPDYAGLTFFIIIIIFKILIGG